MFKLVLELLLNRSKRDALWVMLTAGFDKKKHNATQPLTVESEIWLYCAVYLIFRFEISYEIT